MKPQAEDIRGLLEKANESVAAARHLLDAGFAGFSASRSYYAMFYAAEAALLSREKFFSKHKAVIAAFGKEFVKEGTIAPELHRHLSEAFDMRQAADYGPVGSVGSEKAGALIEQAEAFVRTIEQHLAGTS